jgi:hypothetical protein
VTTTLRHTLGLVLLAGAIGIGPGVAAAAAQEACKPATIAPDAEHPLPEGFSATDQATVIRPDGKPLPVLSKEPVLQFSPDKTRFKVSASAFVTEKNVRVRWETTSGASCVQQVGQIQEPATGTGTRAVADPASLAAECARAGTNATIEVRAARGNQSDFTVILLTDLGVCYANRHFSTEGDPLFVGYARTDGSIAALQFDKCEAASPIPKVLIGGDLATIKLEAGREPKFEVQWFMPIPQCFGKSIEFHLNKQGAPKFAQATITQYERFRATLQVGAVFTDRHIESFGLRPEGTTKVLVSNGPEADHGPEYIASVVVYGLPHYFRRRQVTDPAFVAGDTTKTPRRDPYFGREPVHDNGVADRIGLLVGVGMSQPGRRFVIGGSFEVVSGVNVFLVNESTRLTVLNGFEVGDTFTGEAKDIPLKDQWENGWAVGVSFDVRYAVALFGQK